MDAICKFWSDRCEMMVPCISYFWLVLCCTPLFWKLEWRCELSPSVLINLSVNPRPSFFCIYPKLWKPDPACPLVLLLVPSGKIVITPTPKELWRSTFLTFPNIYLETFWYNYHVHMINHVAMATSFWHIGFGKFKKWWFFVLKTHFLHL